MTKNIKLNIGCGGRPLKGFVNIDIDTLEEIKLRYPDTVFDDDIKVFQYDIFNLPFSDETIDEIRAEGLIEHLPFIDEPRFFYEIFRVLKKGGILYISTVDFERLVNEWLDAEDNWLDFYKNDDESIKKNHWFGTYSYHAKNRWGYLTAGIFGSQNGSGQFHTNCYTEKKLHAICKKIGLKPIKIDSFRWKSDRDPMLGLTAIK
jgi:predicted SAM-dependent methyltransferase